MPDVTFRSGSPVMVDYTHAAADITEGTVVVLGSVTANTGGAGAMACIAHRPIANGALGALAAGGGVYDAVNRNNAAAGTKVYWDDTNNWVTTVSTNFSVFGTIVANGAGGTNSTCRVLHNPQYGGN